MRFIGMPFRALLAPLAWAFLGLRWVIDVLFWPHDWYERASAVQAMKNIAEWVVVGCLCLLLMGCHKQVIHSDPATGHIGVAEWPDCRINLKAGTVDCRCSRFSMDLKKDGTTVMRCAE